MKSCPTRTVLLILLELLFKGESRCGTDGQVIFQMVPDYTVVVEETFSDGSTVVLLGLAKGSYTKQGHVSPGNAWQTPAAWRAHVEDNELTEWRVYADNEPIRRLMARGK